MKHRQSPVAQADLLAAQADLLAVQADHLVAQEVLGAEEVVVPAVGGMVDPVVVGEVDPAVVVEEEVPVAQAAVVTQVDHLEVLEVDLATPVVQVEVLAAAAHSSG
ncbi:MAG: hypothetical protein HKP41_06600 [Desulfobacterales bacterium]|nr:hypothetical protein [Desulfobacterales bacterium]